MKKSLRNKALRDVVRLINGDYNGVEWCVPDGHFAIDYPIYDGYKAKKYQWYTENKPDMLKVLPKGVEYVQAEDVKEVSEFAHEIRYKEYSWIVNSDYLNLIKDIYPDVKFFVDASGYNFTPIEFRTNKLNGVIMPLKR